jgi:hypothetical protein
MIQRVQSIYLLLATIAISILIFPPIAVFTDPSANIYQLSFAGIAQYSKDIWLIKQRSYLMDFIILVTLITSIIAIFFFRNRKEQIRICWLLIAFNLLVFLSFYYEINIVKHTLPITVTSLNWQVILPIISIILIYLAISAIKKDEELVRSMDRIR